MKKSSHHIRFQMRQKFEQVLKRDFNGSSINEVKRSIKNALGPVPDINWVMDKSWGVIRARHIDETVEDITNPNTFGSPPSAETSQGRANLVNHPVFYGTFDSRTAMQEINVPLGTECYVSTWEFENEVPTVTTFLSGVEESNDLFRLKKPFPTSLPEELKGGYTKRSLEFALKLRANAFITENYEFTSKIAHDVIYNNSAQSVGLLYPSVVDPYRCNIALNPDFVNNNMKCNRIYKMVWSGAFIFRVLARGSLKNNEIFWEETGAFEMDEIDKRYSGSFGPNEIHPSALEVFKQSLKNKRR